MSQRNLKKIVALRRDNTNIAYDLNIDDLRYLLKVAAPDKKTVNMDFIYEALTEAFVFGY